LRSRPLLVAASVILANVSWGQEQSANSISREVKDIFEKARAAVVKIHAVDPHGELCGTGFFVDPTGTLYTSYSVGGEADNFTVEFKGKRLPAKQLVADIRSGLAILKVDSMTPTLSVGKSDELEVATPVVSIGFPLDLGETANFGMIAGFDRKYMGHFFSTIHLRANLPTQRGEAGAPLLNFKGEVIGVIVSSLENNSSCYAVPIEAAEKIRNDFVRFGEIRHGWIGIDVAEAAEAVAGSRATMTNIVPETPAAESGVKTGDILLQVGNKPIHQPEDVLDASFYITAGDAVPITVIRGEEKLTFNVQADFHPDGQRPPVIAAPTLTNRAIPLSLQSDPRRSP
jgi:serine protease Do